VENFPSHTRGFFPHIVVGVPRGRKFFCSTLLPLVGVYLSLINAPIFVWGGYHSHCGAFGRAVLSATVVLRRKPPPIFFPV